jgi:hypothetical protein
MAATAMGTCQIQGVEVGVKQGDRLRGLACPVQFRLRPQHLVLDGVAQRRDLHAGNHGEVIHQRIAAPAGADDADPDVLLGLERHIGHALAAAGLRPRQSGAERPEPRQFQ